MTLFLHVLMLFLLSGGSARVVQNFEKECGSFFANGKSPTRFTGSQYKQICQNLNNLYYYATYYDTANRIPVYSAYRFEGKMGCTRKGTWLIEPQLDDDNNGGPKMASEGSVKSDLRGKYQALSKDYEKSGYDRGHLAPVYLAQSQSCADATFTLTNAAPQAPCFNRVYWWNEENELANVLETECISLAVYIVTGVVPGIDKINKVNVPSHFWTAYCCLDQNNKCSNSRGVIGDNNDKNSNVRRMTVADLERELQKLYKTPFSLFQ